MKKMAISALVLRGESCVEEGDIALLVLMSLDGERPVVHVSESVIGFESVKALFEGKDPDDKIQITLEAEYPEDPADCCSSSIKPIALFI